ncbi:MAG: sugar phosphate isomerase/epimerase [Candidatus Latescibacteria bacterium]|nr:sugar phosphate isomerase/epimerase [Candidatus Latescibacterota bacterium]
MRLGVIGMFPADFRDTTPEHLKAIRALGLTGAGFHAPGDRLFEVQTADCRKIRNLFSEAGMDLAQFGVAYRECLFDPDPGVCDGVIRKIERGIEVGRELGAHVCMIRPGSLSPRGSYSPSPRNLEPACRERLLETLDRIARKAEAEGLTVITETHLLTILNTPETIRQIVEAVGSDRIRAVMDYVNHFQSLDQVYHSAERLNQIFDIMGPVCPVGHCKDLRVGEGLVLHLHEEIPGEGELHMATALRLWHALRPDGYMLLEHLPDEKYPLASRNTHRIAAEAGVEIH